MPITDLKLFNLMFLGNLQWYGTKKTFSTLWTAARNWRQIVSSFHYRLMSIPHRGVHEGKVSPSLDKPPPGGVDGRKSRNALPSLAGAYPDFRLAQGLDGDT